jgi:hypothetical protein
MRLNTSSGDFISFRDNDKFLVIAFKNHRLDSIGGRCTAKDFGVRI